MTVATMRIGPYTVGEIPPPLTYAFLDADGNPIDLTDYADARFVMHYHASSDAAEVNTAEIDADPTTGQVTYTWVNGDLDTRGRLDCQFWVDDGGVTRLASPRIIAHILPAVADPGFGS